MQVHANCQRSWGGYSQSLDKYFWGSTWWMGSRCCVVQVEGSKRRQVEGVSTPRSSPRGRKRRGSRGGAKKVKKRRDLAVDAPDTSVPSPVRTGREYRALVRRERTFEYSQRLVDFSHNDARLMDLMLAKGHTDRVQDLSGSNLTSYLRLRTTLRYHRRKWYELRRKTHPGEPEFSVQMAGQMVLAGLPPLNKGLFSHLAPAGPEFVEEILPIPAVREDSEKRKSFWCSRCLRDTPVRVCRKCGAELAAPTRKRRGERKYPKSESSTNSRAPPRRA